MKRAIELYGRLKEAAGPLIEVDLPATATAADAMAALKTLLKEKAGMLEGSVLAGEESVLAAADALPKGRLAALPPVCGG